MSIQSHSNLQEKLLALEFMWICGPFDSSLIVMLWGITASYNKLPNQNVVQTKNVPVEIKLGPNNNE
jgi:hypothetical protein